MTHFAFGYAFIIVTSLVVIIGDSIIKMTASTYLLRRSALSTATLKVLTC